MLLETPTGVLGESVFKEYSLNLNKSPLLLDCNPARLLLHEILKEANYRLN